MCESFGHYVIFQHTFAEVNDLICRGSPVGATSSRQSLQIRTFWASLRIIAFLTELSCAVNMKKPHGEVK
jgi:hypothetical protein